MTNLPSPTNTEVDRGFTLMELIMTMVILSVIALFTLTFIYQAIRTYVAVNERSAGYEEIKFGMERMVREIREAGNVTYPPPGAEKTRLSVVIPHSHGDETVEFRLDKENIIRNDTRYPLISRVTEFAVARTGDGDTGHGSSKLKLSMTFTTEDGQNINAWMEVVPNNLPWSTEPPCPPPMKRFQRDWWEIVER